MPPDPFSLRVVIDANVFISYLLRANSVPGRAVLIALEHCTVVSSDALVAELTEVSARPKFRPYLQPAVRAAFLARLAQTVDMNIVTQNFYVCRDAKDNAVIDTAIAGMARYVITGDDDLLSMKTFRAVEFIKPADFLLLF